MKEVLWLLGVFGEASDAKMMGAQGLRDQGQGLGLSAIREQRQNYKAMESEGAGTAQLIQHELWTRAALGLNASPAFLSSKVSSNFTCPLKASLFPKTNNRKL